MDVEHGRNSRSVFSKKMKPPVGGQRSNRGKSSKLFALLHCFYIFFFKSFLSENLLHCFAFALEARPAAPPAGITNEFFMQVICTKTKKLKLENHVQLSEDVWGFSHIVSFLAGAHNGLPVAEGAAVSSAPIRALHRRGQGECKQDGQPGRDQRTSQSKQVQA